MGKKTHPPFKKCQVTGGKGNEDLKGLDLGLVASSCSMIWDASETKQGQKTNKVGCFEVNLKTKLQVPSPES